LKLTLAHHFLLATTSGSISPSPTTPSKNTVLNKRKKEKAKAKKAAAKAAESTSSDSMDEADEPLAYDVLVKRSIAVAAIAAGAFAIWKILKD
jgi:hypothetical protein